MALSCACVRRWVPFWTGHDAMAEYGNLVGDVFWTLEPAVCLWLPKLLLRPRRDRTPPPKTKAEAPSPSLLRTRRSWIGFLDWWDPQWLIGLL